MFIISEEVRQALLEGRPVLALESTIISHGMPYPQNVETALEIEMLVRSEGAIPATCAVISGKATVGINPSEIEMLGKAGLSVTKISRRDFPYVMSKGMHGACTVAGTMILAAKAGVKMFATGGIGGVHRGAQQTFDISADLQELSHTSVAVVSAGAKLILDIPLTLEYLETMGVPVIGYQTDAFPGFYCRETPYAVDYRLESPEEVAQFLQHKWQFGLQGGVLITNPVPQAFALPLSEMEQTIAQALADAEAKGIKGKLLTPFLLARLEQLTQGSSLRTNIALVKNNAQVGAKIARALTRLTA